MLDDVVPDFFGHVGPLVADIPVVEHPAQVFAGAIDKRLFFL